MFCFALVIILKICIQDMCGFGKVCVFELVINFGNWYMTRIAQYYVFLTSICFLYKDVHMANNTFLMLEVITFSLQNISLVNNKPQLFKDSNC